MGRLRDRPRDPRRRFTFKFVLNERSGEIRIHETMTFVVSADGTIPVQNETFDFSGCPSTWSVVSPSCGDASALLVPQFGLPEDLLWSPALGPATGVGRSVL